MQSIWCYQSQSSAGFEQIQAQSIGQLLINLHDCELRHFDRQQRLTRCIGPVGAQGILTAPVLIDKLKKRSICGVAFSCFGLTAFCDISAHQLTDTIVDASTLWGQQSTQLRNALIDEPNIEIRCRRIEAFLLHNLRSDEVENNLLDAIMKALRAGTDINTIRRDTGLSQRALYRLFERRIGVKPKVLDRIARFGSTLAPMAKRLPLTDVAHHSGYADQAHFSREFRAFTGQTPTQHKPVCNEPNHVRVTGE